jgi:GNAT superfamily N-acetyltransferase
MHALDNPIWNALTTAHARFAEGGALARRYPAEVSTLAGLAEATPRAYDALSRLLPPGGVVGLVLDRPAPPPPGWGVLDALPIAQMICPRFEPVAPGPPIVELGAADAPEMLALAELTKPGPFGPRTHELGSFVGVRESGRLVAMAGERMRLLGHTEVSGVCTHPDHRGRGLSLSLVAAITGAIAARGELPFLHVKTGNAGAIRVYEKLGFRTRRLIHYSVLRRSG